VTPTDAQREMFAAWLAEDAPGRARIAEVARRFGFDPWTRYRLMTTGQVAWVRGFLEGHLSCGETKCSETCARPAGHDGGHDENGDVTVYIYAEHPELGAISGVHVFGIAPATLVPWPDS
jgi:hypothetical protein